MIEWMRARGAVAHSTHLHAAGFSRYTIAALVAAGAVRRVRRSWLLLPECDPRRVAAVGLGGRVTCLSGAELLGLWTPPHEDAHVAVARNSTAREVDGIRIHWADGPASFARHTVDDPLLNVLHHVARCRPEREALAVWESAVRTRQIALPVLARIPWHGKGAQGILARLSALSDSGLETEFIVLMREIGVTVRQQVWIDGHPVDGLIGERLVVQLDGFAHHSSVADRRRDIEADARLALRGYTVLRFDYQQVMFQPEFVTETVRTALAQGLHLAA